MDSVKSRPIDIVIGVVAPLGVDLDRVASVLEDELKLYRYSFALVRLSKLLEGQKGLGVDQPATVQGRMDAGDAYRRNNSQGDAVARLGIAHMWNESRKPRKASAPDGKPTASVIRSIKHKDEVRLLRETYGDRFVLLGVTQNEDSRTRSVEALLQREGLKRSEASPKAKVLILRDQGDPQDSFGQDVRNAYAKSDYFIDAGNGQTDIRPAIERFLRLLFGDPYLTPTVDEYAMYVAYASSLRSSDSTRQVGASIATPRGDIVATGANEVPRAGGGEYWAGDPNDARDFLAHLDENLTRSRALLQEVLDVLESAGHLSQSFLGLGREERIERLISPRERVNLRDARLMGLLEFSRVVHAEMAAITSVARSTQSTLGSALYTTAFPCHLCMRLIVSSGIERVVFVDPYPKSLALDLFHDSVVEGEASADGRVRVLPFTGASWTIFTRAFQATGRRRLDSGRLQPWDRASAAFVLASTESLLSASDREEQVAKAIAPTRRRGGQT